MAKALAPAPRHLAVDGARARPARPALLGRSTFNGMAIAGLVMGLAGIPLFFAFEVAPVLAILFGVAGLGQIRESRGTERGRVLALVAIMLGVVGIGLGVAAVLTGHAGSLDLSRLLG